MTPWSVSPSAGCPKAAARSARASIRQAPSRTEYSEWTWRWANDGCDTGAEYTSGFGPTGGRKPQSAGSPHARALRRSSTVAEQFQRFAEEHIGPASAEVGMAPPQPVSHDVHDHFTAG